MSLQQIANDSFAFTYAIILTLGLRNYIERMKLGFYTYIQLIEAFAYSWVNLKAVKRLVEADALQMEIIPNPKVQQFFHFFFIPKVLPNA